MKRTTSFSQNEQVENCGREWLYDKILKYPKFSDLSYAHAGNVIHECLELYYNGEIIELLELQKIFNTKWIDLKLNEGKLKEKQNNYWLMILNGIKLEKQCTDTELNIYFENDVTGYLDVVDLVNDEISDWKSSTRSEENEKIYTKQLKFYAWLYKRKFNKLPKKLTVNYLKYTGKKGLLSFVPTEEDVIKSEQWHNRLKQKMFKIIDMYYNHKKIPKMPEQCNFFCPYKDICFDNAKCLTYTIYIKDSNIQLNGPITKLLEAGIDKKFSYELDNAWHIKKACEKKGWNINTTIRFWNSRKRILPLGFLEELITSLNNYSKHTKKRISVIIKDLRIFNTDVIEMPEYLLTHKTLRPYQELGKKEFLIKKIAMLKMATGSGKTLTAIEIIRTLKTKTLIIVNRVELLNQWKKELEDNLGLKIGIIGNGKIDIQDVTVATIQTIVKHLSKYKDYLKTINFCIIDECHNINDKSYYQFSQKLVNTKYRLGLSGTPKRGDDKSMYLNAICGNICYTIKADKLIKENVLEKPKIIFIKNYMSKKCITEKTLNLKTGLINETEKYNNVYDNFIVTNNERNNLIQQIVIKHNKEKILILVKKVEHGNFLANLLNVNYLNGSTNKKERTKLLQDFKDGTINILIGTLSIFSEGLDIPTLKILINVSGSKSDNKTIQTLGRLLRKHNDKDYCIYYDFVDEHNMLKNASRHRIRALKKEAHEINYIDLETETFT